MLLWLTLPKPCDVKRPIHDNSCKIASRNGQGLHSELKNCYYGLRHGNGQKDETGPRTNHEDDHKSEQETSALIDFHGETVTAQTAASTQN
jgi:hypothetical protein